MRILKTYKQLLEKIDASPIKSFLIEYESDPLTYSKKYPRNSEYVKNLLKLDSDLEYYYDGFEIEYGRLYIYFEEEMIYDTYDVEDYQFNEFLTMIDDNYEYEIDELQYFIDDKNTKLLEKILKIFNINDIDNAEKFDSIINHKLYKCNRIINMKYSDAIKRKAIAIDNKIENFFFDNDRKNYDNIAVIVHRNYLTDITSITKLLKNDNIENIMLEIKDIKDSTTLSDVEEKAMNVEIFKKLTNIYNFLSKNKDQIIGKMYKSATNSAKTINFQQYLYIGGDFKKELETDKYQTYYIESGKSKLDNINLLKSYGIKLTDNILKKYGPIMKSAKFNL
jgi:hypothetical protein